MIERWKRGKKREGSTLGNRRVERSSEKAGRKTNLARLI